MTTALERVLAYAGDTGASLIPSELMPDGWMNLPVSEEELSLAGLGALGADAAGMAKGAAEWGRGVHHVRTEAGVMLYKAPIGTPITARMREAAKKVEGHGTESSQFDAEGRAEQAMAKAARVTKTVPVAAEAAGGAAKAEGAAKGAAGAAKAAEPAHPPSVSGHSVQKVYTHPQTKRALYDLGHGLHSEGEAGKKPGPVMRSPTGLDQRQMAERGWQAARPLPAKGPASAAAKRATPGWVCLKPPCAPGSRVKVNTDHTMTSRGAGGGTIVGHLGEHPKGWAFRHAETGKASKPFAKTPEEAAHFLAEFHNANELAKAHAGSPELAAKFTHASHQIAGGHRSEAASTVADALNSGTKGALKPSAESLRDSLLSNTTPGHIPVPGHLHGQESIQQDKAIHDLVNRTGVDEKIQKHVQEQIEQLKTQLDNERSKDSRAKLAFHAGVLIAGVGLMALLTSAGVSPVIAAISAGMLPFGTELIDRWKRWV